MDIYLMQHGVAEAQEDDPSRPLTAAGRVGVLAVAARAATAGIRADRLVHSGRLRAEQTADMLAESLGGPAVTVRDGLGPGDPVAPVARWLADEAGAPTAPEAIAVVGHLPFLDRLASLLVVGDEEAHVLRFRNGALVKLEPQPDGPGFSVAWVLPPDLA